MKNLSLVYVLYKDKTTGESFVLMGKQALGKKLEGKRIGFGGKCAEGESTEDCAKREVFEELKMDMFDLDYKKCGDFQVADKNIDCFVVEVPDKFGAPADNEEFVDTKWINLKELPNYYGEMLEGDNELMEKVLAYIHDNEKTFSFRKEESVELKKQTEKIFGENKFK